MPSSAFSSTSFTDWRNSTLINSETRFFPITSSRLNPVIAAILRFHSFTRPSAPMPKMGAFAVSMSSVRSFATRSSSALPRLSSVMSWPTPTTPRIFPVVSRRVVALSSTSTRSPPLVMNGNSKLSVSFPCSALLSTAFTATL